MDHIDVIVIGAGPTGLYTAHKVAEAGYRVVVLEEHKEIGVPVHCAGLVGYRSLKEFNLYWEDVVLNKVRGAKIFSPSCRTVLEIVRSDTQACVLDRENFDKKIYERALSEGAEVLLGHKAIDVSVHHNYVEIICSDRKHSARILVDAEGARRSIAKKLGVSTPSRGILPAVQMEFKGVHDIDDKIVEVYLGRKWSNGFFGWLIPISEDLARIGLASARNVVYRFNLMTRLHPALKGRLNRARIIRRSVGFVITHGPLKKTCGKRFVLVGDAAGHVKPTTGGGIIYGVKGASIASRVILRSLSRDTAICVYDELWRREFGRDLRFMLIIRKILNKLNDNALENLMFNFKEYGLEDILVRYGDIDEQYRLVRGLVKNPLIILAILRTLIS